MCSNLRLSSSDEFDNQHQQILGNLYNLIGSLSFWLQKEVDKAEISGNLDAPEGGFDAIMQAILCNVGFYNNFD